MSILSSKLKNISESKTLKLNAIVRKMKSSGIEVINLSVGEPDFDTPKEIALEGISSIKNSMIRYTPINGIPQLRQSIKNKFKNDLDIEFTDKQITLGNGGKQVIFNAFYSTLNNGDEVIIPSPYWTSYPDVVKLCEGVPVIVDTKNSNFKLTSENLERSITPKTKWLILNSPSNPTGVVYSSEEISNLINVLNKYPNIFILSDDIYEKLIFDNYKFVNIVNVDKSFKDRTLIVNGVSKTYAMTGWRLGYGVGPEILTSAMNKVQSQTASNPCSISQYATTAALNSNCEFLKNWVTEYEKRRNILCDLINSIDCLSCEKPDGAFYVYVDCSLLIGKTTSSGVVLKDDDAIAEYFLETSRVSVVPGSAFGCSPYFRISFALQEELLIKACDSIKRSIQLLS